MEEFRNADLSSFREVEMGRVVGARYVAYIATAALTISLPR